MTNRHSNSGLCHRASSVSHRSFESLAPADEAMDVCAKLLTTNQTGHKEVIVLRLYQSVTVGRSPNVCNFVISDPVVSGVHCKFYALPLASGGIVVSCQDLSTNGIILNGERFQKTSVLVLDGDQIDIPHSKSFKCVCVGTRVRKRAHIFDPSQEIRKLFGKYVVTNHCLGSGSFADVYLAVDTISHQQVACKVIKRKVTKMSEQLKEYTILKGLRHPNINAFLDAKVEGDLILYFLELCTGGDLFTYINSHAETANRLVEGEAKYIMYQLLKGLEHLHDRKISHRDLKPENILLKHPGPYPHIEISDFGLARRNAYQETPHACGTISYLPPEAIRALEDLNSRYVGMPSDCWSAGVILYIMLSGYHPFEVDVEGFRSSWHDESDSFDPDDSQLLQGSFTAEIEVKRRILSGEVAFCPSIWGDLPDAKKLVDLLLVYNYRGRGTVYGALETRWITDEVDELEQAYQDRIR